MNRSSEPSLLHPQPPKNYAVIRLIRWLDNWLTRFVPQEVKKSQSSSLLLLWQLRHAEVFEFVFLITNNEICTPTTTRAAAKRGQGAGKRGSKEAAKQGQKREHRGSKEGASTLPLPLTRHKECQKLVLQSTLSPLPACPWLCFKHLPRQSINK